MKARFESAHRSQIQRQKVEKDRPVGLRCQRNHFPFLILACVVVDPLQVRGLSAETRTVVNQLAVNFACRKIDERHLSRSDLGSKLIAYASSYGQTWPSSVDARSILHIAVHLVVSATTPIKAQAIFRRCSRLVNRKEQKANSIGGFLIPRTQFYPR